MTPKQKSQFNRMREALRLIAYDYQKPDAIRMNSEREYGLSWPETLSMAYENIQEVARDAVKGVRECH